MNLTAGATLQNHKYVIQKLLRQSDLGVTYEAQHAYLAQTVALQTFNETIRQRDDFAQLRQQFLSKVRSIVQQPQAHSVRILDCFEEAEMPFVVLEIIPGQPLPSLTDWLPVAIDVLSDGSTDEKINPTQLTSSEAAPSQTQQFDPLLGHLRERRANGAAAEVATGVASYDSEETQPPAPAYPLPTVTQRQPATVPARGPIARGPIARPFSTMIGTQVVQRPVPVRSRSKAWMPLSLIFLSTMGGILGAGYGLSLRLAPTTGTDATTTNPPTLKPRLFSREQSFPSDADWPISETPQIFTSDPTPIEEPVYRVSPPIESYAQPELPPLPNEAGYQDPYLSPSPSPTLGTATPTLPNYQPAPLPNALTEDAPSPITTTPPQISAPPAPLTPETLGESRFPASEPIEPVPPTLEPAPPALPILPPTDPAVIKQ